MIEQVVAGSDGVEHLLHSLCSSGLVLDTRRLGASGGHSARGSLASESMYAIAACSSVGPTSSTTPASPIPTGSTKRRTPLRFFLSLAVAATSFGTRSLSGGRGP